MSKKKTVAAVDPPKDVLIREVQFTNWEHFKTKISEHLFPTQMFRRGKICSGGTVTRRGD